uniref:50S ribosomal protein L21, chloroplastic n=1 Tax=Harveyella mirabilis TaxID=282355 RepID=A0A3S8UW44_9FLOR|nr:ribosomal protein L21 [Harveyella mirabilis]
MFYAIVDLCGHQMIIEPGKFYDINYINAYPGDIINLKRVLFVSNLNNYSVGIPCLNNVFIQAKILKHIRGKKITIFKIKQKKNYRLKKGHRQNLTRVFIENIII